MSATSHDRPSAPRGVVPLLAVWTAFAAAALLTAGAAQAISYDLQFDQAGPIFVAEGAMLNVGVEVVGGCSPYNITWEPIIVDGTTDDFDYGPPSPTFMSFDQINSKDFVSILINDDILVEDTERFFLRMNPTSPLMTCTNPATDPNLPFYQVEVRIVDNDTALDPTFVIDDLDVVENAGQAIFKIRLLNGQITDPHSVTAETFPGTAAQGVDYQQTGPLVVNFPPGVTMQQFAVNLLDDLSPEENETFFVKLLTATNANISKQTGIATILDDDSPPEIRGASIEPFEGDTTRTITVPVFLDFVTTPPEDVTVDYQTSNGTATAGEDYEATSGSLLFVIGESQQTIPVTILGDQMPEGDETFFIQLTNPDNAVLTTPSLTITLRNDDADLPAVSISDVTVDEGDDGTTDAVFDVTLDRAAPGNVRVGWRTVADTASADEDFVPEAGSLLTFEPGVTSLQVAVPVLGDTIDEDDEQFFVELVNPVDARIDDGQGVATIRDDDGPVGPHLSIADLQVVEGDSGSTFAEVLVTLDQGAAEAIAIGYRSLDGSARAGADYQALDDTLEIPAGDVEAKIQVEILGDGIDEPDETFRVRIRIVPSALGVVTGATIADEEAIVTIVDDDGAASQPILDIGDASVTEGDAGTRALRFPLSLSQPSSGTVSVDYMSADGTATVADEDYAPTSGMVVFEPGVTERFVEVPVRGDTREEDDETLSVFLSNPQGADLARDGATGTIVDDDSAGGGGGGGGDDTVVRLLPTEPVLESEGFATIRAERVGSDRGPVRARLRSIRGTATPGEDYRDVTGVFEWRGGQRGVMELQIPILDDSQIEDEEAFLLRLTEVQGARIGTPGEVRQTIVDDDTPMRLEARSDAEQRARVRDELRFDVRVVREDGAPVAGALVRWRAEGKARIVGDGEARSGDGGIVSQRVLLAATPGRAEIVASLVGGDSTVQFLVRVVGTLGGTADDEGDDGDIADALDEGCSDEDESDGFSAACDYLYGIDDPTEQAEALRQLTPRQALPHQRQALRTPRNQLRNLGARLGALRGGMSRSAFDQLALSIQGQGLTFGPLQDAIARADVDPDADLDELVDLALRRAAGFEPARGGAASGDDDGAGDQDIDYGGESPWGFFFNGRLTFGDAPARGQRPSFDFETEGLTAGIDRRIGSRAVLGAALGYSQSSTDLADGGGALDLSGFSLNLYGTYFTERWYVDAVISRGSNEMDTERVMDLPRAFEGVTRLVAVGSPDTTETAVHVGFGYDVLLGDALTLSGFVRGSWVRAEIDSYAESGAGPFDLEYEQQTLDSLLGEIGFELSYPWSFDWGVLQPMVRLAVLHEFDDDLDVVRARFVRGRSPRTFRLESEASDRDFFNLAVGATATLQRGWATYFQYDTDLERDDFDLYTFSGGFRFQF